MYVTDLIINKEILIPLVLSRNDCSFNHASIYIVNFIGFSQYEFKAIGTCFVNG